MARIAWHNGAFIAEAAVRVDFRDRGFTLGDGCFDTARTFGGKPYLFAEHIARLYNSLSLLGIEPGFGPERMLEHTLELVARNELFRGSNDDWWVTQWVSRGIRADDRGSGASVPTVIIECSPLPFESRCELVRDGADIVTSNVRRPVQYGVNPNIKSISYLNLVLADLEVQARAPGAWSLALDESGHLNEGLGSNVFLVRDGGLFTPRAACVLPGLTRKTVMELAGQLAIPVAEADLTLADADAADEAFITSTSLCILPARSFNGRWLGQKGSDPLVENSTKSMANVQRGLTPPGVPGAVTQALIVAFQEVLGGFDFRGQYLRQGVART